MRNHVLVIIACAGSAAVASSCSEAPLIGEDGCFGAQTRCDADPPTLTTAGVQPVAFDVVSSRTLTPRWTRELPCGEALCAVQVVAGDGTVWASLSETSGSRLIEVDGDGAVVQSHEIEPPGGLVMDAARNPHVVRWESDGRLRVVSPDDTGRLAERTLQGPRVPAASRRLTNVDADGSVTLASFEEGQAFVARYDAGGALVWRQNDLRVAKRFPYEDLGPGIAPIVGYDMRALDDGSMLLAAPRYTADDRDERAVTSRWQGITLLDQDGNVRWDALITPSQLTQPAMPLLASGPDGSFVLAYGTQDSLFVSRVDSAGEGLAGWLGHRVDYYAVVPRALCVDSLGSVYVALLGGKRDDHRRMLCKFDSATDAEPTCAMLELPEPELPEGALVSIGAGVTAMACPAPGHVVVAPLARNPDLRQTLVGFEF